MDKNTLKKNIFKFFADHQLGVVSTNSIDRNSPESAVVGFANTPDLEIVFGTMNTTRKYNNILNNPHVSLVIGWSSERGTVQYEGKARELKKEETEFYMDLLIKKRVENKKYVHSENQRFFLVKPTWIRFVDNSRDPHEVFEVKF